MNKKIIFIILITLVSLTPLYLTHTPSIAYAHSKQASCQDNKHSNCGQHWEYYFWQQVPSLSIKTIECNLENKLSINMVLQPAVMPGAPWEDTWKAEGKVYFNDEEMGVFDIRDPSCPAYGINSYSYGEYNYLLPWEITSPIDVRIVIYVTDIVEVSGWTHYPASRITGQMLLEPISNPSNAFDNTPDTERTTIFLLLIGISGLSFIFWIGFVKNRGH